MKYSNELKVGVTLVAAIIVFILGVRYFEDLPLFRGTFDLTTEFDDAGGLTSGNVVRVSGVNVGSVEKVYINPETNKVRVEFQIDSNIPVPRDSYTSVGGFAALGVLQLELHLGTPGGPLVEDGGFVPSQQEADLFADLTDRAPELLGKVDTALFQMNRVLTTADYALGGADSELNRTLATAQSTMQTLEQVLRAEQQKLSTVLDNTAQLTADLSGFTGENKDSLAAIVQGLNASMRRLDATLNTLDNTATNVDALIARINNGEGTLGMLLADSTLYLRLDSTITNTNELLEDFKAHPGRYIRHLRLIDLF